MIIALFDSGVDHTHAAFRSDGAGSDGGFARAAGMSRQELGQFLTGAMAGGLAAAELAEFERLAHRAGAYEGASAWLLPGRDFAGHHPDSDLSETGTSTANIFDYNGHGTSAAGVLVRQGHAVLPVKIGYSLAPEISLPGLVAGCQWLLDERSRGLACDTAVWTFGISGTDYSGPFRELTEQMTSFGVKIYASGRGVYHNITAPGEVQLPSDLPQVVGIDELLVLDRYRAELPGGRHLFYHLPGSPRPPARLPAAAVYQAEQLAAAALERRAVVACCPADQVRTHLDLLNRSAALVLVTGATRPYVTSPLPYVFTVPVLVSADVVVGLPLDGETCRIVLTVQPRYVATAGFRSAGAKALGRTGRAVPAAHTGNGWTAAFGSSIAAPAGLRPCTVPNCRSNEENLS